MTVILTTNDQVLIDDFTLFLEEFYSERKLIVCRDREAGYLACIERKPRLLIWDLDLIGDAPIRLDRLARIGTTPIIVLSSQPLNSYHGECARVVQAIEYIQKPIDNTALHTKVAFIINIVALPRRAP